ncbi:XrtY-associated glycosyltransferase XYAG1 [Pedobacter helvus]|uniref:XrtY-associated glycosyltransferase XYAG1 n=1 Tax=Pedobacter helvus TaxID=2563444 RepID=A0ABW9JMR5_9SPHI|nr:glycosyltransferase [Pedobacter ureilyticus]
MKIIQICAAYKPAYVYGGPTMSVAKLSEELTKAGHEVTVLATTANGKEELNVPIGKETLVDGVKVYYFKRLTKDHTHFSPALLWFLHQTIKSEKQKTKNEKIIVHIHAWWNLVSIFSCLVAKLHGVKVILSPRGMLTNYSLNNRNSKMKDAIHFFLGKSLLKYAYIHATSEKEKEDVAQTSTVSGIRVIPNFVNFPNAQINPIATKTLTNLPNTYKLLFLSRIEEKKGLEILFEALSQIAIPYQLSIAGTGEQSYIQSLKNLAERLGIQHKLTWLGHVANEQKFELLAQSDLLVLTSYNENFANVVIESLAVGTPVLISEEVGLAAYVKEHQLGWVCGLDPTEISSMITKSYGEEGYRKEIRLSSPSLINEHFANTNLIKRYEELYNSFV